jgi:hypothetical protein
MRNLLALFLSFVMTNTAYAQYDAKELARLLNSWGTPNTTYDLDGNGTVGPEDIAIFLGQDNYAEIGAGFTEPTPEPPAIGIPSDWAFDAKAIARWTTVPRSEYTGPFSVGVVAFHVNGINRVDFSVNGGAWKSVYEPKLNPDNNVEEYFVKIDPLDHADGVIEIRAIAYPNIGIPRVLQGNLTNNGPTYPNQQQYLQGNHGMLVVLNGYGTLPYFAVYISPNGNDTTGDGSQANPFNSMGRALKHFKTNYGKADGGTIYLMEGVNLISVGAYSNHGCQTFERYLTFRPAPGLTREQVKLNGNPAGGLRVNFIKVEDVTFYTDPARPNTQFRNGANSSSYFWANRCHAIYEAYNPDGTWADPANGGGFALGNGTSGSFTAVHVTNCSSFNTRGNVRSNQMVINYRCDRPGDTPFSGAFLTINAEAYNPIRIGSDHLDGWHWFGTEGSPIRRENHIMHNIFMRNFWGQGMMYEYFSPGTERFDDVALVNIDIEQNVATSAGGWWEMDTNHLLIKNVTQSDQNLRFKRPDQFTANPRLQLKNVLIENYCGSLSDFGDTQPVAGSPKYLIEPNVRVVNWTSPCPGECRDIPWPCN